MSFSATSCDSIKPLPPFVAKGSRGDATTECDYIWFDNWFVNMLNVFIAKRYYK